MNPQHLRLAIDGRLATITLDRPAARNAMSRALMSELLDQARSISERSDIDVVILTGGSTCFSAGADLRDTQPWAEVSKTLVERREMAAIGYKLCAAWEAMPQMTIASIEGYAVGGGLALSLACDWRVVASDAFVSLPEIALGIPLTWGAIPRLVNLVGPAKAKRLTVLCERFGAAQALEIGLIDYVSEPGQALARALALANQTLAMPSAVVRMSKESVNAIATALNHASSYMGHDQIVLAAASQESIAARGAALRQPKPAR